jgi:hypothetical protein
MAGDDEQARAEERRATAVARAAATTKEPFDPAAFETAMGGYHEARDNRSQLEYESIEASYYLSQLDLKTMDELAQCVIGIGPIRGERPPPERVPVAIRENERTYTAECSLCGEDAVSTGPTSTMDGMLGREFECNFGHRFMTYRSSW